MAQRIEAPAGFVPQHALAFAASDGTAVGVDGVHPLPIAPIRLAAASAALAGTLATSGTVGPFLPELDRPIWILLTGGWAGTVSVLRSIDGGATKVALTAAGQPWGVFSGNAQEAIGEESVVGAAYYLQCAIMSGMLTYQVAQ